MINTFPQAPLVGPNLTLLKNFVSVNIISRDQNFVWELTPDLSTSISIKTKTMSHKDAVEMVLIEQVENLLPVASFSNKHKEELNYLLRLLTVVQKNNTEVNLNENNLSKYRLPKRLEA